MLFGISETKGQVFYDETSLNEVVSIEGGATWASSSNRGFEYNNNGTTNAQNRALLYSTSAYQSEDGFKLTIEYNTESIDAVLGHNFSFGLISSETDLSTYAGFNPFRANETVYSIGANLTTSDSNKTFLFEVEIIDAQLEESIIVNTIAIIDNFCFIIKCKIYILWLVYTYKVQYI